jgi:hypothetical protein
MAEVFVASHEKPFTNGSKSGFGQNGFTGPSSIVPGDPPKSPIADVSPPQHGVESLRSEDHLSARVKMGADGKAAGYAAHDSMRPRGVSDGSPGGVIGSKTSHSPKR